MGILLQPALLAGIIGEAGEQKELFAFTDHIRRQLKCSSTDGEHAAKMLRLGIDMCRRRRLLGGRR